MKHLVSSSKTLKAMARLVVENPCESPFMEFRCGLWSGVSSLFSENGRQLGEANTRPRIFHQDIATETHSCTYKGSRYGKLINISALRTAMGHFYPACAITVAVRDYLMQKTGRTKNDVPGIWDLYFISRASLALIAYHYRADRHHIKEKVPNDISSQYMMVTGIFMICQNLKYEANEIMLRNNSVVGKDLYDYADAHTLFQSDNGMVCAGSAAKIIEFLEFAIQGRNHKHEAKLNLDQNEDHLRVLKRFVSDLDKWFEYALRANDLDFFIETEALRQQIQSCPEDKHRLLKVLAISEAQKEYWLQLFKQDQNLPTGDFAKGVLYRQNAILELLEKKTLNNIPKRLLKIRLSNVNATPKALS